MHVHFFVTNSVFEQIFSTLAHSGLRTASRRTTKA